MDTEGRGQKLRERELKSEAWLEGHYVLRRQPTVGATMTNGGYWCPGTSTSQHMIEGLFKVATRLDSALEPVPRLLLLRQRLSYVNRKSTPPSDQDPLQKLPFRVKLILNPLG
jgi:hypothetical protein